MDVKFIDVSGVPTKIFTWGNKLGENFDRKEIVLCITGNPGLSGFYFTFLTTLFSLLQGKIPVWIIGELFSLFQTQQIIDMLEIQKRMCFLWHIFKCRLILPDERLPEKQILANVAIVKFYNYA